jgi:hypothetical protein
MSIFSKIYGLILGTNPATPSSNRRVLFAKSDGWYDKDTAGVVTKLLAGSSGVSSYRATLLGANGALTSTTASKNDFGSTTITGAYVSEGVYTLTASTAIFTANKTIPTVTLGTATGGVIVKVENTSTTVLTVKSFLVTDGTTAADFIGSVYINVDVDAA